MLKNDILVFDSTKAHPNNQQSQNISVRLNLQDAATIICLPDELATGGRPLRDSNLLVWRKR